eukprot:CAMPEP_0167768168 /NCGR_PEP_ID=MMETSP0110_2-20121227/16485_1 /TAXON_ID=629695 /ORGANISM="Gymnochlora sp., Strain CCMP2014" /LENGTH=475 /DNA_ID=CAMNT_0007656747 /DNA_START=30 /DNA_END=1457 /DNA_ORIENTATION=-
MYRRSRRSVGCLTVASAVLVAFTFLGVIVGFVPQAPENLQTSKVAGFRSRISQSLPRCARPSFRVKSTEAETERKRDQLKKIKRMDTFNRMGFKDTRGDAENVMGKEFESSLIKEMRENMYTMKDGDITFKLAKDFGFCWGVERAVQMAIEAKMHYGDKIIHITNEIIHNPGVNEMMEEMGVKFIPVIDGVKDFSGVEKDHVVILPAFGATLEEMKLLSDRGVQIVDTTCPWVSKVWNSVDRHIAAGHTSIIHGSWAHEETIATASFAEDYIIVKNMEEAEYVANYILNGGDKAEFMEKFKNAVSKGFDPDIHLKKLGLANQTTMYKKETRAIGQMLQKTMMQKYGPENVNGHYMEFDTICDATQERQDAIHDLVEEKAVDFFLVVGGWDSSNTRHLVEIPEMAGIPAYHIDKADRLRPDNSIEYRTVEGEVKVLKDFIPSDRPVTIGVTSGASTPDAYVEDSMQRIKLIKSSLG